MRYTEDLQVLNVLEDTLFINKYIDPIEYHGILEDEFPFEIARILKTHRKLCKDGRDLRIRTSHTVHNIYHDKKRTMMYYGLIISYLKWKGYNVIYEITMKKLTITI